MTAHNLHGVRMWVTEGCNASCHFCMNVKGRANYSMEYSKYQSLCQYFKYNNFDKIAIMGGEPTIHPDFEIIMETAQTFFPSVYLFTNGLKIEVLKMFNPRDSDAIVYNFHFQKVFNRDTFMLNKPGKRVVDIVIDSKTDVNNTICNAKRIASISPNRIILQLVINNTCNIFKEKEQIIYNVNTIYSKLAENQDFQIKFECNAPLCFTENEQLPPYVKNTFCSPRAVLIDGSYNVRFCNIFNAPLINMFQPYGMIPFSILENYINMTYIKLRLTCLDKICKDCLFYGRQCNGKCHIGQDSINREDISQSTNLPWLK